jgi:tetratricopeptide (TPR) repeat protein
MDIAQLQKQAAGYLEQGQYSDAIVLYQQCIDINPTLLSNYSHLGLALLLEGEELEAQAVWLSALAQETSKEIDASLAELLKVLSAAAIQHIQSGNVQLAERICWQILELDSNRAEAHYYLGTAIAQRGDLDEAVAYWQRAIELKPDFADAYQNQGCVLQKQEKFAEAIPCYLKVLEIKPDWTETHYNLGICFSQQDKLDEAIACFQKAIQLKPDYTQAYGDWGHALLEQGNLDEAITCFQKAIQLKPAFAQAYCSWGDALVKQGKSNQAITSNACFLKALQVQPQSADAYWYLGKALVREKKFDRAVACYKKALQIQPGSAEIYFDLGQALVQQGNLAEAIACFLKALQMPAAPAEVYLYLGKALAQQGNLDEAISCYQNALEANPGLAEVYFYLGNALVTSRKLNEAIAFYKKQLEIQPNSAEVYCNLGIALAQRGDSEEAIACFQKAMEINTNLAELIYNLMIALCQQGKLDKANAYFQKLLPIDPPNDFYELTSDWAVTSNLDTSSYINIYPKNQLYLTPPKTPDSTVHFSFRFGTSVELPATFIAVVPEGRYWLDPSQAQTAIITSDNKLLADVSPDFPVLSPGHPDKHPSKHAIFSSGKLPPVHNIDGTVAVLSGLLNDVYFHWMFDVLPRIELLRCSGIDIGCIDYFLINSRNFLPFHREALDVLGIPETKRLKSYKSPHIKATRLVVPSFPGSIAWMPKWSCDFLRRAFLDKSATERAEKIERIYISCGNVTNRRIINEDEVISLLNKFGFKSVTLESMSVAEQASLMADAKVVVAPHGSGLTNIVFCKPGTKVIEIFSPNYVYPCYWLISNIVGLGYYYLVGESSEGFYLHKLLYPSPRIEDIFVNIDLLLKVMKFAEVV